MDGWEQKWTDESGFVKTTRFSGAFAYYGNGPIDANTGIPTNVTYLSQRDQLVSFTNRGRFSNYEYYLFSTVSHDLPNSFYPTERQLLYGEYSRLVDFELYRLPADGFSVYDLPLINSQHEYKRTLPSFDEKIMCHVEKCRQIVGYKTDADWVCPYLGSVEHQREFKKKHEGECVGGFLCIHCFVKETMDWRSRGWEVPTQFDVEWLNSGWVKIVDSTLSEEA